MKRITRKVLSIPAAAEMCMVRFCNLVSCDDQKRSIYVVYGVNERR